MPNSNGRIDNYLCKADQLLIVFLIYDNNIYIISISLFDRIENIVGKGKNADYQRPKVNVTVTFNNVAVGRHVCFADIFFLVQF